MEGTITMFNAQRGFGFLACGVREIFFHAKYFAHGYTPLAGRRVKFDLAPSHKGRDVMAVNLEYIDLTDEDKKIDELMRLTSLAGGEQS